MSIRTKHCNGTIIRHATILFVDIYVVERGVGREDNKQKSSACAASAAVSPWSTLRNSDGDLSAVFAMHLWWWGSANLVVIGDDLVSKFKNEIFSFFWLEAS